MSKEILYNALDAHFEPMPTPEAKSVETLADLTPAIERFHILVGLGRYDDACQLYYDRLAKAAHFRLAAAREIITWLECLFPKGTDDPPALTSDHDRGYVMNALGQSYVSAGQLEKGVKLLRRAIPIYEVKGNEKNLTTILETLGLTLSYVGHLREAMSVLLHSLATARSIEDGFGEAVSLQFAGRVMAIVGRYDEGYTALSRARKIFNAGGFRQSEGVVCWFLAERALLLGDDQGARRYANRAWELAGVDKNEGDFVFAGFFQGSADLMSGDIRHADERLHHALTRARAVNVVEIELRSLVEVAKLEHLRGRQSEAKTRLDDFWDSVEAGLYPRERADAHNVRAAIAEVEKDNVGLIIAATEAYKSAWCDGPPYSYYFGLNKAKHYLAACGAPEPKMAEFDERKFDPLPKVDINRPGEYWVGPEKFD